MSTDCRVVFTPSGLSGTVESGVTVLEAARIVGADLDTVCGGRGICGRCQVRLAPGHHAKWDLTVAADALSPPGSLETDYRGSRPLGAGQRLGCSAAICGDVVVDVPPESQVHRQVVRKDLHTGPIDVDPRFTLWYLEVPAVVLGEAGTAATSVLDALAHQHDLTVTDVAPHVLSVLHGALADEPGAITVAVDDDRTVVAAWPGFVASAYGVAVDIGSTTVAAHLCDLTTGEAVASGGRMNPQIRYGEDLMSRVSYVMMNPGGDVELTAAIRTAIDDLVAQLCADAEVASSHILEVVLVGNPIMHHVVLGIDPTPLGSAPFVLATDRAVITAAVDLDLDLPNAAAYVGPCIAGHVGADTAAAVLAEGPHRSEHMQLLVDVGTNAEIVLGDRGHQYAASSPTGPAFEGAQISCGQRATAGAIERVRIDRATLEPRVRVIGVEQWSDAPDFGEPDVTGVCGSGIIEVIGEMFLAGIIDADGVIRGEQAERTGRVVADGRTWSYVLFERGDTRFTITQNDVRAIQLAKAALRAGIDLLVERAGSPTVSDIRLAGAFGANIDPVYALVLGLVPDCPVDGVRAVGNAAGAGAVMALLSMTERHQMEAAVRSIEKIETATEPRFQELFVQAMAFPHATAPSSHLAAAVELPPSQSSTGAPEGRRRRRRVRNGSATVEEAS